MVARLVLAAAACFLAHGAAAPALSVTHRARFLRSGEVVLITINATSTVDAVHVRAFDRDWPVAAVSPRRWRALVGLDVEVRPGKYAVAVAATSPAGPLRATHTLTVTARRFRTRTLSVDPAFVTPPESAAEQIAQDSRDLEAIYVRATATPWFGSFTVPVPHAANSAFGSRSVFNGELRNIHAGADFGSPPGTPIKAPGDGEVALARDLYFSGHTVVIDHGLGLVSVLAHMSTIGVTAGARVRAGDVLGRVGATGRVTGPHLHWGVRLNGARVDPLSLLFVLR